MSNKQEVIKAFRQARITGEQMLSMGKISWEQFEANMRSFEMRLEAMGVNL
jgi:hypothetical protein